jgi:hypothetical protein
MDAILVQITATGRAALVAPGNTGTAARRITQIGLCNQPFKFTPELRALPNELKRITTFGGENVAPDTVHVVMQDDSADQYTLFGFGLYFDDGTLFGVVVQNTAILEKSPAAIMLLAADAQFTTIDASKLQFGDATFLNPPATTERKGVIELATQAEVDAGIDATRAITPVTLQKRLDTKADLSGAQFGGPISAKDAITISNAPGGRPSGLMTGNGDGADPQTANIVLRSGFGIGLGPSIDGMPVPQREYSHWFDVRTGNTGMRGTLSVGGVATAQTPPANDASRRLATTEWVLAAIATAAIGTIVLEVRTTVRARCVKLNGALLSRADYPALWAYAQSSGALVSEQEWFAGRHGCFSTGDGATDFRIPEFRGEHPRFWDDGRGTDPGRGIGSWQDSQNRWHGHGASCGEVGDHAHGAWTDGQGNHNHHGWTGGGGDHQHVAPYSEAGIQPWGAHSQGQLGSHGGTDRDNPWAFTSWAGSHNHEFYTEWAGQHGHNVGIGGAGRHAHEIWIAGDGGNESRGRNVAMLAMMRAY